MKRLVLILFTGLLLGSCATNQVVKESRKTLKGHWNLDNINYGNAEGEYKVKLLEDVSSECFVGSTWRFIPNNNFGNYEINGTDCAPGKRYFVWTIPSGGKSATSYDILLKPTDSKMNSTMNNEGFRLNLDYLSNDSLRLTQTLQVNGKSFTINMNFTKISD